MVGKLREYDDEKGKKVFDFFENHVNHHIEVIGDFVHVDHDFAKIEDDALIIDSEYIQEK